MKVIADLEEELSNQILSVEGNVPTWLQGTMIRNGPINFSVDGKQNRHWFDGLAMLHAFTFDDGKVVYTNKFLRTNPYHRVFDEGKIDYVGFAVDPCRSLFKRFYSWLSPLEKPYLQNANINIAKLAEEYVAYTETPLPIKFDPKTLDTLGVFDYQDNLIKEKCWESAHPHRDENLKETINYLVQYGFHSHYLIYRIRDGSAERETLATVPVEYPSYMHSFAVTKNYVILVEYPLVVKPLEMMIKGLPFIDNYHWKPERQTIFTVVDRNSGNIVGRYPFKPFYAFHQVNAFENEGKLCLDMIAYDDARIIWVLADHFREKGAKIGQEAGYRNQLMRFTLSLSTGEIEVKTLFTETIEFPRLNPYRDGLPYRYVYGIDPHDHITNEDVRPIYKVDTFASNALTWKEKGCYPGEPLFVPLHRNQEEDEGVILNIILNLAEEQSFLLILDAKTFQELARATISHKIPIGLHSQFFSEIF